MDTRQIVLDSNEHPGEFRVLGLGAGGGQIDILAQQIVEF